MIKRNKIRLYSSTSGKESTRPRWFDLGSGVTISLIVGKVWRDYY